MNEALSPVTTLDPHEELSELVSAAHALVEWYASTGSLGLLVDGSVDDALGAIALAPSAPRAAQPRAAAAPVAWAPPPAGEPQRRAPLDAPAFTPPAPPALQRTPAPMAAVASAAMSTHTATPTRPSLAATAATAATAASITSITSAPAAARPAAPITGASTNEDRRVRLAQLASEAGVCMRCALHEKRKQAVIARGNPFSELCFVGEGPGAEEDAQGEPFVGPAGQLLDKMITAMGYQRDEVYICNIVKCRPPNNRKPEPAEIEACVPFVREQIALVKPKIIVALGATAVQGLLGTTLGITRLRGTWKLYNLIPVMPTFHPAYLLRNPAAKREVWSDLQEVMKRLGKNPRAKN